MTSKIRPVLKDPATNKGTGFSASERKNLGLEGYLPPIEQSLELQASRVIANMRDKKGDLEKYCYLRDIQDTNEILFYRVVLDNMEELLPIIYTPTVGQACISWSQIVERERGLYLSAFRHRGQIEGILEQFPEPSVIVVTDGGRILGLGDLGVNGMGIPIGKLSLYTACAGISPDLCLPVSLDVGTDNESLRNDPLYLGERQPRLNGEIYDEFMEEFVTAVSNVFPNVILQFEDFNNTVAFKLLDRYRDRVCCFNDDVQGTGAMALAGLFAVTRMTGKSLSEQRILFVGSGEAGLGMGKAIVSALQREGLTEKAARAQCLFMDSEGLVVTSREDLPQRKQPVAQDIRWTADLDQAIEQFGPTVLIGACGQGSRFEQSTIETMSTHNERPVIFALSNPTSKAECTAEQAYQWSGGRAIYASGSPFAPVLIDGLRHASGQGNNAYIFPGVGLGLLISGASRVTDEMFIAAAHALTHCVSDDELMEGRIFPAASRMREVAAEVAASVAAVAFESGIATRPLPEDLLAAARTAMFVPSYD